MSESASPAERTLSPTLCSGLVLTGRAKFPAALAMAGTISLLIGGVSLGLPGAACPACTSAALM
jgi:hypothetical protein